MKVLLATDGSEASLIAVDRWVTAAAWFSETPDLSLVTVHAPVPMEFAARHVETLTLDRYYSDEGHAALAPAAIRLKAAGISYRAHVLVGQVAETLISYAADQRFDWIWMGARGHGLIERVLLGSVAARVVQLAHCPVMVAR